jgi:hypothetical protein
MRAMPALQSSRRGGRSQPREYGTSHLNFISVNYALWDGAFPGRVQISWHFPYQYAIIYLPVGNLLDKVNNLKYTGASF